MREKDGFRGVATKQSDDSDRQAVMWVSAMLPGKSTVLSVPTAWGLSDDSVRITRRGDVLVVVGANAATVSD
jgi:hypothetical protein